LLPLLLPPPPKDLAEAVRGAMMMPVVCRALGSRRTQGRDGGGGRSFSGAGSSPLSSNLSSPRSSDGLVQLILILFLVLILLFRFFLHTNTKTNPLSLLPFPVNMVRYSYV
jgi:hypothetical protein